MLGADSDAAKRIGALWNVSSSLSGFFLHSIVSHDH